MKRQATSWEKIFANQLYNEGLVSKMYKKYLKLSNKKISYPVKKKMSKQFEETLHYRYVDLKHTHKNAEYP